LADGTMTVLLVEHDMEVVFRLARMITVLHRGAVIADGSPEVVRADAEVQRAYLGGLA
jgi:branched-chain amino acid transport system ATP-binding protein